MKDEGKRKKEKGRRKKKEEVPATQKILVFRK